jgi:hypothetical protein
MDPVPVRPTALACRRSRWPRRRKARSSGARRTRQIDGLRQRWTPRAASPRRTQNATFAMMLLPMPGRQLIVDLRCEDWVPDGAVEFDLHGTATFPAVQESRACCSRAADSSSTPSRFSQVGGCEVGEREFAVTSDQQVGFRDRSWASDRSASRRHRAGRLPRARAASGGSTCRCASNSFALIVSLEEDPDGHRTLSDARRIFAGGRVEQLGWPRAEIRYPGTRSRPGST